MNGRFIGIKNIKGRQEFMRMLNDMEDGKDGVDFVLVFKLSRFGRNVADVLSSLQLMRKGQTTRLSLNPFLVHT